MIFQGVVRRPPTWAMPSPANACGLSPIDHYTLRSVRSGKVNFAEALQLIEEAEARLRALLDGYVREDNHEAVKLLSSNNGLSCGPNASGRANPVCAWPLLSFQCSEMSSSGAGPMSCRATGTRTAPPRCSKHAFYPDPHQDRRLMTVMIKPMPFPN
jgi:hypothetical protein